uniref:AlNc14C461G11784 protein n=1 Tax=Albugo laibachii Nc14 TaxID=890382 RepID=F0X046_9STRA|nr:AlNc14C461G11784 [Albugo laibachii Nc14]|eukprot:CCA27128.1 AlNc14C461G11784 [Albugo laibachii Nc14]
MPTYFGYLNDSLELFFFRVKQYCQSQGIDMDAPENQDQVIAFIAVKLRGAAAWYQQVVMQDIYQIALVEHMEEAMKLEFVPVDNTT